ncbi:MAG: AtpZ/AtpI family protein [Phycisphaerae bacterium]
MARGKRDKPSWVRFSGIGIEFAGAVAGLSILGYYVDQHYGSGPWGVLIGAILGLIGGMYNLIRASLASLREYQIPLENKSGSTSVEDGRKKDGSGDEHPGP